MSNIIFFVPERDALGDPILRSQVFKQIEFLVNNDFKCLILGMEKNSDLAKKATDLIYEKYKFSALIHGSYRKDIPFISKYYIERKLFKIFKEEIYTFKPTYIYTRDCISFLCAEKIARKHNLTHIYDVRGVPAYEAKCKGGKKIIYSFFYRYLESNAIKKADKISCISSKMGEWIYRTKGRKDFVVIPSCVSEIWGNIDYETRIKNRGKFQYSEDNKVICYVGDISKWQRIPSIIDLFKNIIKKNKKFRFLFIINNTDYVKKISKKMGLSNEYFNCLNCLQDEVVNYLKASDAGIIMRDNILINNVASPLKIGEYLSCGLPVILTKGIGDFSELIDKYGVGLVLDEKKDMSDQVIKYFDSIKVQTIHKKCTGFAKKYLTWNAYINRFEYLYSK